VFPLSSTSGADAKRVMNLYVDRTQATLAERRLVLAERLASLGRVAQGVAHELNTPLATIRTLAADMTATVRDLHAAESEEDRRRIGDDIGESAALLKDETRRLGRITQALLAGGDLVRPQIDGSVPLAAVVERARALVFAGVRDGPQVDIDPNLDTHLVAADPDRLVQVLVNLLQNAYDAVREREGGGHVVIRAHRVDGAVQLVLEDDGVGIDPQVEDRLFEPFATTKPPGQGTGLGLYTSYMLAQAMGGTLSLEPRDEGGTRAIVRLPAGEPGAAEEPASQRAAG
ncbi:MAG: sensor histidine kinase, partial [Polyangiales bacterium]